LEGRIPADTLKNHFLTYFSYLKEKKVPSFLFKVVIGKSNESIIFKLQRTPKGRVLLYQYPTSHTVTRRKSGPDHFSSLKKILENDLMVLIIQMQK
jgi:hypothetical protein